MPILLLNIFENIISGIKSDNKQNYWQIKKAVNIKKTTLFTFEITKISISHARDPLQSKDKTMNLQYNNKSLYSYQGDSINDKNN